MFLLVCQFNLRKKRVLLLADINWTTYKLLGLMDVNLSVYNQHILLYLHNDHVDSI